MIERNPININKIYDNKKYLWRLKTLLNYFELIFKLKKILIWINK